MAQQEIAAVNSDRTNRLGQRPQKAFRRNLGNHALPDLFRLNICSRLLNTPRLGLVAGGGDSGFLLTGCFMSAVDARGYRLRGGCLRSRATTIAKLANLLAHFI